MYSPLQRWCTWGLVRLIVMKLPILLKAESSVQAQRETPKTICTDRIIGTWKADNMEDLLPMKW